MIYHHMKVFTNMNSSVIVLFMVLIIASLYQLDKSEKAGRKLLTKALENFDYEGDLSSISDKTPVIPLPERKDVIWGMLEHQGRKIDLFQPPCIAIDRAKMAIPMVLWMNLWEISQKEIHDYE